MNQETSATQAQPQKKYKAKHTFQGEESQSQLSFPKGSIITCHNNQNNPNDAWWLGSIQENESTSNNSSPKLGWFPSSYVTAVAPIAAVVKLTMMGGPKNPLWKKNTSIKLEGTGSMDAGRIAMQQLESFSLEKPRSTARRSSNTTSTSTNDVSSASQVEEENNDLFGMASSVSTNTSKETSSLDLFPTSDISGFATSIQTTSIDDAFSGMIDPVLAAQEDLFPSASTSNAPALFGDTCSPKPLEEEPKVEEFVVEDTPVLFGETQEVSNSSNEKESDLFGNIESEDDFGDFNEGMNTTTIPNNISKSNNDVVDAADDFGDFDTPTNITTSNDEEEDDDFGDFTNVAVSNNIQNEEEETTDIPNNLPNTIDDKVLDGAGLMQTNENDFGNFGMHAEVKENEDEDPFASMVVNPSSSFVDVVEEVDVNDTNEDNFCDFTNVVPVVEEEEKVVCDDPFANLGSADDDMVQDTLFKEPEQKELSSLSMDENVVRDLCVTQEMGIDDTNQSGDDDFGDFSNHGVVEKEDITDGKDGDFGDFSNHGVVEKDEEKKKEEDDDFGDFSDHGPITDTTTEEPQTDLQTNKEIIPQLLTAEDTLTPPDQPALIIDEDDPFAGLDLAPPPTPTSTTLWNTSNAVSSSDDIIEEDIITVDFNKVIYPPSCTETEEAICTTILEGSILEEATGSTLPLSDNEEEENSLEEEEDFDINVSNVLSMYADEDRPPPPPLMEESPYSFPKPTTADTHSFFPATTSNDTTTTTSNDLFFPPATATATTSSIGISNVSQDHTTSLDAPTSNDDFVDAFPATSHDTIVSSHVDQDEDLFGDFSTVSSAPPAPQPMDLFTAANTNTVDLFASKQSTTSNDFFDTTTAATTPSNDLFAAPPDDFDAFATFQDGTTTTVETETGLIPNEVESKVENDTSEVGLNDTNTNNDGLDDFGTFEESPASTNKIESTPNEVPQTTDDDFGFDDDDEFDDFGTFEDYTPPPLNLKETDPVIQEADVHFLTIFQSSCAPLQEEKMEDDDDDFGFDDDDDDFDVTSEEKETKEEEEVQKDDIVPQYSVIMIRNLLVRV